MATPNVSRRLAQKAMLDATLLIAAGRADTSNVQLALVRGADVNASDVETGGNVMTYAIAGLRCV